MIQPAFFDRGQAVGWELNKNKILYILIAFLALAIFCFLQIPGLNVAATRLLGLTICVLILWITEAIPVTATSFILIFAMPFLSIRPLNTVLTDFGTSPFLWVMCLIVVAGGMSHTSLARRISYWYILWLGTNAPRLLLAMFVTSTTLSIFISDAATIAMIYPIAKEVLNRIGINPESTEEEGKKLGTAMMIGIPIASLIGGCGLMSGSGINIMGMTVLEKFTGMTIGYLEWAYFGLPFVFIATLPAWWVLVKIFKVNKIQLKVDRQYIQKCLKDLGPFKAEEKRILSILTIMFILFFTSDITHIPLTLASFVAFILTISPGIGVVNWQKAQSSVPWDAIIIIGATTGFAYAIKDTGLGPFFIQWGLGSWISGVHPYLIVFIISLIGVLSHVLILGNNAAALAVYLGCVSSMIGTIGLNPVMLMLPAIFTGATGMIIPIQLEFFITKPSGFWDFKDVPLPGMLISLIWVIVLSLVLIVIGSLRGYI